ncbi:MAG: pyridoxal phosphate-dependent aminotransferase [Deltaproteobacteria bacterium]|nr:pyridoxal phosphate-dependent aminotransferase [Deltaproteobacteria bacterium]
MHGFGQLDLAQLRRRRGEKWALFPPEVLPLWVADMDFPVAQPIRQRLQQALDDGDLGYPRHPALTPLRELFAERMQQRFAWQIPPRRVELITEVVQGMQVAVHQFCAPGDGVIVQTPIYPPFLETVHSLKRRLIENPLRHGADGFAMDLDGLRAKASSSERARVLLLCNPHNPSGRAFTRAELEAVAEIAVAHDLTVISDEIHADLTYSGRRHIPLASLSPEIAERTLTLYSASKSFNLAGLRCAFAAFGGDDLRARFLQHPRGLRGGLGALGLLATESAWRHGDGWLAELLVHLQSNRDFTAEFLRAEMPGVVHTPPEATYLAWLDCRALKLAPSPCAFFLKQAKVALSDGPDFGAPGAGFVRLNFATSRAILGEALERMAKALR